MTKNQTSWHLHTGADAIKEQKSSMQTGLSHQEAALRITQEGYNKLESAKSKNWFKILISQFADLLILVLVLAAAIAIFLGEPEDAVAILAIVFLNATLGFVQEFRAERAAEALRALIAPLARVRRGGQDLTLPAIELVPGDIVFLEGGNIVPADLRLLETNQLNIDESLLTGESQVVMKDTQAMESPHAMIAEQKNMAFKGTLVTSGRAIGLVIRTGMKTEIGRIAQLLKEETEVTSPLQKRIGRFAKKLSLIVLVICVVFFFVGLLKGESTGLMFMTALSLAVAAIPEALPAVVTMSLALGASTMAKINALIRKLPAVEALGSVTFICSDKTGTLTQNKMQAKAFYVGEKFYEHVPDNWIESPEWTFLLKNFLLNNDVTWSPEGKALGDPTEIALVQIAELFSLDKKALEKSFPRAAELPFSSERGMMSTIHNNANRGFVLTKGAPEKVLPLCQNISQKLVESAVNQLADKGYRVLALAHRDLTRDPNDVELMEFEKNLNFLGLVGLIDPPRAEAKQAIKMCTSAGIHPVMITGDHPATALAVARELGMVDKNHNSIMTGAELQVLSETELRQKVKQISVYARVVPEQKIRIVKALQSAGEIVAMTGDGVNDSPALRSADVGVSMGKGGTDVAREASHIILLDDNFSTIVAAVREGRRIYDNIRKFIRFALSGNSGEMWTIFLAPFLGLPTPLLPIQILWVNLVTDGLPGLALSLEPEEKNIMDRPPRSPQESFLARGLWQHTVWVGLLTAGVTLATLAVSYFSGNPRWQSMAFTVLTFTQMSHVLAIRSERESLFAIGLFSNLPLLGALIITVALQLATLYVPFFQGIFKTEALTPSELLICIFLSSVVFIAVEIEKWLQRRLQRSLQP